MLAVHELVDHVVQGVAVVSFVVLSLHATAQTANQANLTTTF